ncbi:MAG: hypothetical protein Q8S09_04480 [Hyphomonas sp.]|nr:hypothetical protein [Hyphomonas sp.]
MAAAPRIRVRRGSRAEITAAAGAAGLLAGEPLLVTDEGRPAVALGADSVASLVVSAGVHRIAVISQSAYDALDPPDAGTLYLIEGPTGPTGALPYATAALGADVSMPTTGTWYDGPQVTLAAGVWMVTAHVTFIRNATTVTQWIARLFNGATAVASGQMYGPSVSGHSVQLALTALIELSAETTITLQGTTNAGDSNCLMKAATAISGSGNHATRINAVRIA